MSSLILEKVTEVRNATTNDIERLIILRKQLLSQGTGHYVAKTPEEELLWQENYRIWLSKQLNNNSNINVIVSHPINKAEDITGCAIGIIDERVPFIGCLNGKMGWIQTVVVRPDCRRQGLAASMMEYLFQWFNHHNVGKVTLQTTEIARSLYDKIGFVDSGEPLLIKTFR